MTPSQRLAEMSMTLPAVSTPVGSYVPAKRSGPTVATSGQLPMRDGRLQFPGKVPGDVSIADAAKGAEMAALNALSAIAQLVGGIDLICSIIRVGVYVNSSPGFTEQPKVANGASDLLVRIFGDSGRHARAAVGVAELPLNSSVEVELWVELAHG